MRAEAAGRAQAADSWMMAALITTNGGAVVFLLNHADDGLATIIAAALFVLGITAALIAGRLSATLAHETAALFVCLMGVEQASRHSFRAAKTGEPTTYARAIEFQNAKQEALGAQRGDFDRAPDPGPWLGAGVLLFLLGCMVAGVAIF